MFRKLGYQTVNVLVSFFVGCGLGLYLWIMFLQTPVFSPKRLLLVILLAASFTALSYFLLRCSGKIRNIFIFSLLLALLLGPVYTFVKYPVYPLFQENSLIEITIVVDASQDSPAAIQRIWLKTGDQKYTFGDFIAEGSWIKVDHGLSLPPGCSGKLYWRGRVDSTAVISIQLPNADGTLTLNWGGKENQVPLDGSTLIIHRSFSPPNSFLYLSMFGFVASLTIILFLTLFALKNAGKLSALHSFLFVTLVMLLSVWAALEQLRYFKDLNDAVIIQLGRHHDVLAGIAPDPWQYRVFSEWFVEFILVLFKRLYISNSDFVAYFFIRIIQNILILGLAYYYYRSMCISPYYSLFGVILLGGSLFHVFFSSDFSINTYFDVIFYLLAGYLIQKRWLKLLLPVIVLAALNRETSGLILAMMVVTIHFEKDIMERRRQWLYVVGGTVLFMTIFTGLRIIYPHRPLFVYEDISPGTWGLLLHNLQDKQLVTLLFTTLGFTPVFSFITLLKNAHFAMLFLAIIPIWFAVHVWGGVLAETRLFLVPQALVLIPGTLMLLRVIKTRSLPFEAHGVESLDDFAF